VKEVWENGTRKNKDLGGVGVSSAKVSVALL